MKTNEVLLIGDKIASELRKKIFNNELQPGDELVQESLAEKYGTSRMPIRQALQILSTEGLITLRKHRSAIVNGIDFADLADHFEIRGLLEGEAAAYASMRGQDFNEIIYASQKLELSKTENDLKMFEKYNRHFHEAIWEQSKSPRLKSLLSQTWNNILLGAEESIEERIQTSCFEHDIVMNAILMRKPRLARVAMYDHVVKHNLEGLETNFDNDLRDYFNGKMGSN